MTISETMDVSPCRSPPAPSSAAPPGDGAAQSRVLLSASQEHRRRRRHRNSQNESVDELRAASPALVASPCAAAFRRELRSKTSSTSTPFSLRTNGAPTNSSGFGDVSATSFSPAIVFPDGATVYDDDDLPPLPRLSLEAVFSLDDDDSAFVDSAFVDDASTSQNTDTSTDSGLCLSLAPSRACAMCRGVVAGDQVAPHCEACVSVLARCQPACPDRLIGRRVGRQHVDIVGECVRLDLSVPISFILCHLEDCDLCSFICVSRQWQSACLADQAAGTRRARLCESRRSLGKENACRRKCVLGLGVAPWPGYTASHEPLASVQCVDVSGLLGATGRVGSGAAALPTSKAEQFWTEAMTLRGDESLCVCPSCAHPARMLSALERARCTSERCAFDFCTLCRAAFHGARVCASLRHKKTRCERDTIGGRLSRQNLRRL